MVVIGLDTHIATCDFYAVNSGSICVGEGLFETSAKELVNLAQRFKTQEIHLVIEQGPLTDWICRILKHRVHKIIVAESRRNRWIANDDVKFDRFDAKKLAKLYLGGFSKEVVQRNEENEELVRLVLQHHDLTKQRTQIKNKLKAKYRQNGIWPKGDAVYNKKNRDDWKSKITNKNLLWPIENLFSQLDLLDEQINQTDSRIEKLNRKYPIIKKLDKEFPGVGLITAATFVALIDTPFRFSTVKKVWTYCGFGLDRRSSGRKEKDKKLVNHTRRLTKRGNRLLKCLLKQSTLTAVTQSKDNKYRDWYIEAVTKGKPTHKAMATCARKRIKDMWLFWRKYIDDEKVLVTQT